MTIESLSIPDVLRIIPKVHGDERGFFFESFRADVLREHGVKVDFVQDNISSSTYGVLRGLHYQAPPHAQGKLVRVVVGEVFDVAVDMRRDSPHFGQWVGHILSGENKESMYVPPGFAHGFCVLSASAVFHYKCTAYYAPEAEGGIAWNDPDLAIAWPLPPDDIIVSARDAQHPRWQQVTTSFSSPSTD